MYDNNEEFAAIKSALKTPLNMLQAYSTIRSAFQRSERSHAKKAQKAADARVNEFAAKIRKYMNENGFLFSGQLSDIAICIDSGFPPEELKKIKPPELREAVSKTFSQAMNDGYIMVDAEAIKLTDKGKELISQEGFFENFVHTQKARISDLSQEINCNFKYVNFDGTINDLAVFRYTDKVDLTSIYKTASDEQIHKVLKNFKKLEKRGLVRFNGTTITPNRNAIDNFLKAKGKTFKEMQLHDIDVEAVMKRSKKKIQKGIKLSKNHIKMKKTSLKKAKQKAINKAAASSASSAVKTAAPVGVVIKVSSSLLNLTKQQSSRKVI